MSRRLGALKDIETRIAENPPVLIALVAVLGFLHE